MTLEILTTSDAQRWQEVLDLTKPYDFYHLPAFHRLAENNGEGEAVMPVFSRGEHIIAFPMLFRQIDEVVCPPSGTCYRDAGCIYGFAGPLTSSPSIPKQIRQDFCESLNEFYAAHNVVSAFCRLHPIADQRSLFEGYGNIVEVGATTSIDLTIPPDQQVSRYRRNHRQDIDRLRRMGYTCREVGTDYLDHFTRIYLDTMDRVNADSIYYFTKSYFEQMMLEMGDVVHLFACEDANGGVASVALCAVCNGIIQVHLAGTDEEHRRLAPMKLAFDTIRAWGNEIGAHTVHLGGGVGAKRDSLYSFKMGFGSREHIFCTWQHVVDRQAYDELCHEALRQAKSQPNRTYFPEYRNPCLRTCMEAENSAQPETLRQSLTEVSTNARGDQ